MKFITKCETRMEDYDCYGNMTLKAVLQLFENVASYQSDTLDESIIDNSFVVNFFMPEPLFFSSIRSNKHLH